MDNSQIEAQGAEAVTPVVRKQKHVRYKKLQGDDLDGFPGANPPLAKVNPEEETYSIVFNMEIPGQIGTVEASTRCFAFANDLDVQAKAKSVGSVDSIMVANGGYEVVLKLAVIGKPAKVHAPALSAFTHLKDFLDTSDILKKGPTGKATVWKAKVKGTTIAVGQYA